MAKENTAPETEQAEPATTDLEEYQVSDLVDDATAVDDFNEYMKNKYVYEAKIGGRTVRGLTVASYNQLALENNITTLEVEEETSSKGVKYTVCVAKIDENKPKELWQKKYGVAYGAFGSGSFDPFIFQKTLSKATRNGIKQLIKATDQEKAIMTFMDFDVSASLPQGAPQAALPAEDREKARKAMFATYGEKKAELEAIGITEEIFRGAMHARFKVESRNDLTTDQYKQARSDLLLKGFAPWIQNAAPKQEQQQESEIPY